MFLLIKKKINKLIITLLLCFFCCLPVGAQTHTKTPAKQKGVFSTYFEKVKSLGESYKIN